MSAKTVALDRHKRNRTRHRGITYRLTASGERRYSVYFRGSWVQIEGGEREALAKQAELRGKAHRGEVVIPTRAKFAEVTEQWFESKRKLRPWTRMGYRAALDKVLLPRFGHFKLAQITPDRIAALIRELEAKGLSASTISNYLLPLAGTMGFAVRRGLLGVNPFSLLTPDDRPVQSPRRPQYVWSPEDIARLLAASEEIARRPESQYDYSPLLRMAVYTGLRQGELLGLQWGDIDLESGELNVRRQWSRAGELAEPKTPQAMRRIPLAPDVVRLLAAQKLRSEHSKDDDLVFASKNGTPLSHRNVQRRGFESAARLAAIEGVTFHDLRHAFASRMIARGISSTVIAALMGHTNSGITERVYIHLFDKQRTDHVIRAAMSL